MALDPTAEFTVRSTYNMLAQLVKQEHLLVMYGGKDQAIPSDLLLLILQDRPLMQDAMKKKLHSYKSIIDESF
jgi:hypothetical protein